MVDVNERLPTEYGQYEVETNHGKAVAFWTINAANKKVWLCINEDYKVLKWKEQ